MLKDIHGSELGLGEAQIRLTNITGPLVRLEMDLAELLGRARRDPSPMRLEMPVKSNLPGEVPSSGVMILHVPVEDLIEAKREEIRQVLDQTAKMVREIQQAHDRLEKYDLSGPLPQAVPTTNATAFARPQITLSSTEQKTA